MPGVKKLAQESETQSKPAYLYGHHWGCAGVLIGKEKSLSCVLLSARIHDGLQATKDWEGSAVSGDSHVVEMIWTFLRWIPQKPPNFKFFALS